MIERSSRSRERALGATGVLLLACLLSAARLPAQQGEGALYALDRESNRLTWDGLPLGTSLVAAERKIGVTLALGKNPADNVCANFIAEADFHGIRVTLGFKKPSPSAKIDWMRVRFEGQQVAVSSSELVAELKSHFPEAEWNPPAGGDVSESDDLAPVYTIPGKQVQYIRLFPREAMEMATATSCFG